jgi:hypothetical protein
VAGDAGCSTGAAVPIAVGVVGVVGVVVEFSMAGAASTGPAGAVVGVMPIPGRSIAGLTGMAGADRLARSRANSRASARAGRSPINAGRKGCVTSKV